MVGPQPAFGPEQETSFAGSTMEPVSKDSAVVTIAGRKIGPGQRCFVIAEAGVNHNGDMALAHQLIDAAAASLADAVKFQSFITEELVTPQTPKAGYQIEATGRSGGQFEMLKALELSPTQHAELKAHCMEAGIQYLCTPYEHASVAMLDHLEVAAFKIASTDTTNTPLLRDIGRRGRPIILSTGMCDMAEVEQAVATLQDAGAAGKIILLHCTSSYPTVLAEVNLRAIATLKERFHVPVGFSDHTMDIGASSWAVAAGACVIEKHLTLDRLMRGPDHRASIDACTLGVMIRKIRELEMALGNGIKQPMPSELQNKLLMQKSLVARRSIASGEAIQAEDLTSKRPGSGISPRRFDEVIGKRAAKDIPKNGILNEESISWE